MIGENTSYVQNTSWWTICRYCQQLNIIKVLLKAGLLISPSEARSEGWVSIRSKKWMVGTWGPVNTVSMHDNNLKETTISKSFFHTTITSIAACYSLQIWHLKENLRKKLTQNLKGFLKKYSTSRKCLLWYHIPKFPFQSKKPYSLFSRSCILTVLILDCPLPQGGGWLQEINLTINDTPYESICMHRQQFSIINGGQRQVAAHVADDLSIPLLEEFHCHRKHYLHHSLLVVVLLWRESKKKERSHISFR